MAALAVTLLDSEHSKQCVKNLNPGRNISIEIPSSEEGVESFCTPPGAIEMFTHWI